MNRTGAGGKRRRAYGLMRVILILALALVALVRVGSLILSSLPTAA
jgi:hypothetical protein